MSRAVGCVVAIFLACSTASAQNPGTLTPGQPGGFPGAAPPRDNPNAGKGTATLRGHVVAADTGQPLRKAQVRILSNAPGPNGPQNRATATDGSGKYEFKDLPAGRYTVNVSKGSYINLSYGQRRPNEPGKPIEILDGQTIEKIDFSLPRGAILTGTVVDELGEPAENVQMALMQQRTVQGRAQLVNAGRFSQTNDLGQFRIVGVPPGQYYLSATMRNFIPGPIENDDRNGYAPTYYPGTPSLGEALRLTLAVGQTVSDLTMTMVPARTARISGIALNSQGRPMTSGNIIVGQRTAGVAGGAFFMSMGGLIKPDGSFVLSGLAPGDYTLSASTQPGFGEFPETASAQVTLAGQDIDGVQLLAAKLSQLIGRIVTADASAQSLQPGAIRLVAASKDPEPIIGPGGGPGRVNDDLTFVLQARPGMTRLNLIPVGPGTPSGWSLKAVRLDGVDVTDAGFEVKVNEDITGLEVELTNRVSVVSGLVTGSRGEAVTDYSAIVFSQDRERLKDSSRYFRTSRADQDGRYKVTGLPAGDYFAIAVDDSFDTSEATSSESFDRLSSRAVRFSLGDAETKSLDLKLTNVDR